MSGEGRRMSRKQETLCAQRLGGKVQPASGARFHSKGDVRTARFLVECKATQGDGFRLTQGMVEKIAREAESVGKIGIIEVQLPRVRVCVIPSHLLEALT